MSNGKRVWWFILYPESAPSNWIALLNNHFTPWVCSPLHNMDIADDLYLEKGGQFEERGGIKYKKSHYHVILFYDGQKSFSQVLEVCQEIHGVMLEDVESPRGAVRYLIHIDHKNKAQYLKDDIRSYYGCDIDKYFQASDGQIKIAIQEIQRFILDQDVLYFNQLCDYALFNEPIWFYVLTQCNTNYFKSYLIDKRKANKEVD